MVKKKYTSKRLTLNDKYKIKRNVVQGKRKKRKQAKRDAKNGVQKLTKKKRDPGIPNSWPFKGELLEELACAKALQIDKVEKAKEEKQRLKEMKRRMEEGLEGEDVEMQEEDNDDKPQTLQELMERSSAAREKFQSKSTDNNDASSAAMEDGKRSEGQSSRRAYLRDLKNLVDSSDVLLQILDARDPMGTRASPAIENSILSHVDKRMVLVLNKIDLVPKTAVRGWLAYLRKFHPTLALKSGISSKNGSGDARKSTIGRRGKGDNALYESSEPVGMEGLMSLLKNYARCSLPTTTTTESGTNTNNNNDKGTITVGVIGYPNVGKSSIINALKRCRAVGVSSRPGFTTSLCEVVLDKNIRLMDSPGVVFDDGTSTNTNTNHQDNASGHLALKNCINVDSMEDPFPAVQALLQKCNRRSILMTYEIANCFDSLDDDDGKVDVDVAVRFCSLVATRFGRVKKGGVPDKVTAARMVLKDWNCGKVPYFTPPPEDVQVSAGGAGTELKGGKGKKKSGAAVAGAKIVSEFQEEFRLDLDELDQEVMGTLDEGKDEMDFVQLVPVARKDGDDNDNENFMDDEDDQSRKEDVERHADADGREAAMEEDKDQSNAMEEEQNKAEEVVLAEQDNESTKKKKKRKKKSKRS